MWTASHSHRLTMHPNTTCLFSKTNFLGVISDSILGILLLLATEKTCIFDCVGHPRFVIYVCKMFCRIMCFWIIQGFSLWHCFCFTWKDAELWKKPFLLLLIKDWITNSLRITDILPWFISLCRTIGRLWTLGKCMISSWLLMLIYFWDICHPS